MVVAIESEAPNPDSRAEPKAEPRSYRHPAVSALIGLNDRAVTERFTALRRFEVLCLPLVVHRAAAEEIDTYGCIPAVYEAAHVHLSADQQVGVLRSLRRQLDVGWRWARIGRHINRNALTLAIAKAGAGDDFWNSAAEIVLYGLVGAFERLVMDHSTEGGREVLARRFGAFAPGDVLTLSFDPAGHLVARLNTAEGQAA